MTGAKFFYFRDNLKLKTKNPAETGFFVEILYFVKKDGSFRPILETLFKIEPTKARMIK